MKPILKRILGIDLGLRRTGLAVSDELHITTRALPNLTPQSRVKDVAYLLRLCQELEVGIVVIGYPLSPKSEEEGPMARRARGFSMAFEQAAKDLGLILGVHLLDESMTSKKASKRLVESGIAKKRRQEKIDGEAARILIEDFIAHSR
jgi:putative holliday junction resolvase